MKKRRVPASMVIDNNILEKIDQIAAQSGRNRAEIIREAIAQYVILKIGVTHNTRNRCINQIFSNKRLEEK